MAIPSVCGADLSVERPSAKSKIGGKQPGAVRKPGSKTKKTQRVVKVALVLLRRSFASLASTENRNSGIGANGRTGAEAGTSLIGQKRANRQGCSLVR